MDQHNQVICVGHITGAQGLKGWVKVYSNTSPRENIVKYSPWIIDSGGETQTVEVEGRLQGRLVLAKLAGVDDRDQASGLIGSKIYIRPEQLPQLEEEEYYWLDLIGMQVESLEAEALGQVEDMMETGANDVMVVRGDRERLIPFVLGDIVRDVDKIGRRIIVDWRADY